jgi:hypothetical protein
MKKSDLIRTALAAAEAEGQTIEQDDPALLAELLGLPAPAAAAPAAPVDQVVALQRQVAELQTAARRQAAATFAAGEVAARRALPAERGALEALYLQAAEDDAAHPLATPRVAQLAAQQAARPAHVLTTETVGDAPLFALAQQAQPVDPAARKRQLMGMTAVGRTALKRTA